MFTAKNSLEESRHPDRPFLRLRRDGLGKGGGEVRFLRFLDHQLEGWEMLTSCAVNPKWTQFRPAQNAAQFGLGNEGSGANLGATAYATGRDCENE